MGMLDSVLGGMLGNSTGQDESSGRSKLMISLLPVVLSMLMNNRSNAAGGGGLGDVLGNLLPGQGNQQMSGGGLSSMLGGLLGGGAASGLGSILGGLLGGGASGDGLSGLLEQFQQAGFGEQANSWVSTGQNLPISPEAIGQVFGSDTLAQIAQQVGVSQEEASAGLSELLPEVVNHLTPNGTSPDFDQLSASVSDLVRQFGG